jgi:hypothetical protein
MAAGMGVVAALAGCSGNGSDGKGKSSPEENNQTDSETQTETSNRDDTVYDGEEELEIFIHSRSEFIEDDPDYYWIEFEDPTEQIERPIEADGFSEDRQFNYFVENGSYATSQTGTEYEIDGMYLTIPKTGLKTSETGTSGEQQPEVFAFSEEAWDQDATLQENIDQNIYWRDGLDVSEGVSEDEIETLFSEDIQAHNDASEDFPPKYLDLIDQ